VVRQLDCNVVKPHHDGMGLGGGLGGGDGGRGRSGGSKSVTGRHINAASAAFIAT
jgi:hypothetical protein